MKDEVLLAAILLAAAGLLLVLTIVMLFIIVKSVKSKSTIKEKASEIPKTTHHYDNSAFLREGSAGGYGNTQTNNDTRVSYYSNDSNDGHKSEWPTSYNMYAVSRSYAFPKAGDHSEQNSELGSRAYPSNPPSTIASRSSTLDTREAHHDKSFSEEVFEGINQGSTSHTTAAAVPRSDSTSHQESDTRIWKSRTPSETASLHSHETSSVHGSTVSQGRDYRVLAEQRSYYSSFKPRKVSVSSESQSQVTDVSKNSGSTRERIATQSVKTSGTTKVFTFDLS